MPPNEEIVGTGTVAGDSETSCSSLKRLKFLPKQIQPRALLAVLPNEECIATPKEKTSKPGKKVSKRKVGESSTLVEEKDPPLGGEEWHESPKKSPRKQAAVSKVNQFLSGVPPWKEGGQKGFITPPLMTNVTEVEGEGEREREEKVPAPVLPSRVPYPQELPEDHEVADVLLKLLSPVSANAGDKLFTFNESTISNSGESQSATLFTTSAATDRQLKKEKASLLKSDETDGELTELCIRHENSMSAAALVFQSVDKKEKGGKGDLGTGREKVDIRPLSRNWLKTDSKGLLNHFRSLSALADLAATELTSPSGSNPPSPSPSPSPVTSLPSQCVLLPRPSGGGLAGFSRLNTPLKILTVSKSLFQLNGQQSPPLSTTSLSSSDGQWTSSQTSRSHSRSSADTSRDAESPISISPDSLTSECPSSGSGTDTSRDSVVRAASFLSVDSHCEMDRTIIKLT